MWARNLPWQWFWVLFAAVLRVAAAADIQPYNSSAGDAAQLTLAFADLNLSNSTILMPVTRAANQASNPGDQVFLTTDANYTGLPKGQLAFITCDRMPGNLQAADIVQSLFESRNAGGIILFSTNSEACNYTDIPDLQQALAIYSTTSRVSSQKVLDALRNQPSGSMAARVQTRGQNMQNPGPDNANQNPLGPSPSTAVAMIILYSITGIITALFLVIIITGAVRAHRHPERYGPRDVLGRPRQSRARGLGRAILDTLPIVKFGEREQPKPTDVELGSTAESRGVQGNDQVHTSTDTAILGDPTATMTASPPAVATERGTASATKAETQQHETAEDGIAPAQPIAAGAAVPRDDASPDEALGCSICTDDFEKGQDLRVLPCNHKFHPECVDPWLLNVSGTCPLCRVDLRPVASNTSEGGDPDLLAPPLNPDGDPAHRRRSGLHALLSFRTRPTASPEERISALRRLREQRRNLPHEGAPGESSEDVSIQRRSKRLSVRLSDVFGGSRRRNGRDDSPPPETAAAAESSRAVESSSTTNNDAPVSSQSNQPPQQD